MTIREVAEVTGPIEEVHRIYNVEQSGQKKAVSPPVDVNGCLPSSR
jgi:hypothetical protein